MPDPGTTVSGVGPATRPVPRRPPRCSTALVAPARRRCSGPRCRSSCPAPRSSRAARARDGRPARGLRPPAAGHRSTRRCSPSSAARPAPASRRWSTRWSGSRVTEPGVLRPTTRSPVLVHNPADARLVRRRTGSCPTSSATDRADRRPRRPAAGRRATRARRAWPILDAPDIDSVEERNRTLAAQLLAAADLWLFVTSAARYADQVPWDFLRQAAERSTAVAIVLDRTAARGGRRGQRPPGPDARRPRPRGLPAVHRHRGRGRRRRPAARRRRSPRSAAGCDALGRRRRRPRGRGASRPSTARSARSPRRTHDVADARRRAGRRRPRRLREDVDRGLRRGGRARSTRRRPTAPCCAARCWPAGRSSSAPASCSRSLETKVGWLRDRLVGWVKGKPQQAERVTVAVESGPRDPDPRARRGRRRARRGVLALGGRRASTCSSDAGRDLGRASRDFRRPRRAGGARLAARACSRWCAPRAPTSATTARFLAFGVNGLSVALMVVVFAHTAGARPAPRSASPAAARCVGQKLLEAVFGDQAVRRLADAARKRPRARGSASCSTPSGPATSTCSTRWPSTTTPPSGCATASRRVDDLRFADQLASTAATRGPQVTAPIEGAMTDWSRGPSSWSTGRRPGRPHRRARGRRSEPRAAGCDDALVDEAAARRRRAPAPGCGSPATTPSWRSPAPPARASPRRSTR